MAPRAGRVSRPRAALAVFAVLVAAALVVAGDLSDRGTPLETAALRSVVHAGSPVVFVAGNHDSDSSSREPAGCESPGMRAPTSVTRPMASAIAVRT